MTPRPRPRRPRVTVTVLATLVAGLLVSATTPAAASDAPPTDRMAARIVARAADGQPLRVVTTTLGAQGRPEISTTVVSSRDRARLLVARALRDRGVETVSLALPVRTTASNDTLRPRQWG